MTRNDQKSIFLDALEIESESERKAFVAAACANDSALRDAVEELLSAHSRSNNLLDRPLAVAELGLNFDAAKIDEANEPAESDGVDHVGLIVGNYKLMEQIGEGGFGLVFVAQQLRPVTRKVALKIVKPGAGSKEVLARFDAERQAVAMMDHPCIAKVFDAGVTEDGRPYFVMELVRGVPISDFCDNYRLSIRKRLELFCDVCAAVHHAHQKGIIHRDLKPSNVMVTLHDDRPVVKVIDFGIAKAIGQNLTDQTIYTRFFSMIGTPLYMSPEQAEMSGLDVDTRSDIYSLGVMLYELLTGTTPFDRERLDSAGYDEMRRIIREEEPPKPSRRLTTLGERLTTVSEFRHSDPRRMLTNIRGDLDWIVMKALEKDRVRRYESAAEMGSDIERFLRQEPITARPPSNVYRLMKFSRRNRVAIVTGSLVALALLSGSIMSFYQARVAIAAGKQKDLALQAAIQSEVEATRARLAVEQFAERLKSANALLASARADEIDGNLLAAKDAYTQAIDLVPNYYLVWIERARFRNRLPLWQEASQDFAQALEIDAPLGIDEWQGVSALFALQGMTGQYDKLTEKLLVAGGDISKSFTWGVARSLLPRKLDDAQAQELAELCRQEVDSQPQPRAFGDGPEGRYYGPRGPGLGQGPGQGPRLGKGPGQGPGPAFWPDTDPDDRRPRNRPDRPFGGRSDGDRPPSDRLPGDRPPNGGPANDRDPRYPMHTPFGVQQYVAAWASVRAGNYEKAIEHGELAMQDRGWMGGDSVHALLALAYEASGRHGMAEAELLKSSAAIQDWLDGLGTREPDGAPWFDRVEAVLLHNEASLAVNGNKSELLVSLEAFQASLRDTLAVSQSQ